MKKSIFDADAHAIPIDRGQRVLVSGRLGTGKSQLAGLFAIRTHEPRVHVFDRPWKTTEYEDLASFVRVSRRERLARTLGILVFVVATPRNPGQRFATLAHEFDVHVETRLDAVGRFSAIVHKHRTSLLGGGALVPDPILWVRP